MTNYVKLSHDVSKKILVYSRIIEEITREKYTEFGARLLKKEGDIENIATKIEFVQQWSTPTNLWSLDVYYPGYEEMGSWHSHHVMSHVRHSSADHNFLSNHYRQKVRNILNDELLNPQINIEGNMIRIGRGVREVNIELPNEINYNNIHISNPNDITYFSLITYNDTERTGRYDLEQLVGREENNSRKRKNTNPCDSVDHVSLMTVGLQTEPIDLGHIIEEIGEKLLIVNGQEDMINGQGIKIKDHSLYKERYQQVLARYTQRPEEVITANPAEEMPFIKSVDTDIIHDVPPATAIPVAEPDNTSAVQTENLDQIIGEITAAHRSTNSDLQIYNLVSKYNDLERENTYYMKCLGYLFIAKDHPIWNKHYKTLDKLADEIPFSKLTDLERRDYLRVFSLAASDDQLNGTRHKKVRSLIMKLTKKIEAARGSKLNEMIANYPGDDSKSVFIWNFSQLMYADPVNYINYKVQRKEWSLSYHILLQHMQEVNFKSDLSVQDLRNLETICNSVSERSVHMPRKMRKSLKNLTKKVKEKVNKAKAQKSQQGGQNA